MLLGRLLLLTIREDISVPYDEFAALWAECDLEEKLRPAKRTPEDAFRRATPRGEWSNGLALLNYRGQHHVEEKGRMETVLVLSRDSDRAVDIHHLNRAVLYLSEGALKVRPFTPLLGGEQTYIEVVKERFAQALTHIDGGQCRNAIQRLLGQSAALTYRDGSYLIPAEHSETADAIVRIVTLLNEYAGRPNILWDIPYIDTPDTRSQVARALEEHLTRVGDSVLGEASKLKPEASHRKNVGRSRRVTLTATLDNLDQVIKTYEVLLGQRLPEHWEELAKIKERYHRIRTR